MRPARCWTDVDLLGVWARLTMPNQGCMRGTGNLRQGVEALMTGENKDVSPPALGALSLEGADVFQMWVSCDGCQWAINCISNALLTNIL